MFQLYALVVVLMIPAVICGVKRGTISRRSFLAMIDEMKAEGYEPTPAEVSKLHGLWMLRRKSILEGDGPEDLREIAAKHIAACVAASRPWKIASHVWSLTVVGVFLAWAFLG